MTPEASAVIQAAGLPELRLDVLVQEAERPATAWAAVATPVVQVEEQRPKLLYRQVADGGPTWP